MTCVPYLAGVSLLPERVPDAGRFPFLLPCVQGLDLALDCPVTFFVGENGSGKSTLLLAIAQLCRLPVSGGGRNEFESNHGPDRRSELAEDLRPSFRRQPGDGYFLRAEFHAHFASLLDQRRDDPDFVGDPYARYGGRSLHERSHGEAFLALLQNRFHAGLFLLDEPESALSPQRQLTLLALMKTLVEGGRTQIIVATHSPVLMTFPGATILSFDGGGPPHSIALEATAHDQIVRGILESPERYWRHLGEPEN